MTHYTIILNRPESILRERFPRVQLTRIAGTAQHLVWDGPAAKTDVSRLFEALAPYAEGAILSSGRGARGKTIDSRGKWS